MAEVIRYNRLDVRSFLGREEGQTFLRGATINQEGMPIEAVVDDLKRKEFVFLNGHRFHGETIVPGVTMWRMMEDAGALYGAQGKRDISEPPLIVSQLSQLRFMDKATDATLMAVQVPTVDGDKNGLTLSQAALLNESQNNAVIARAGSLTLKPASLEGYGSPAKPDLFVPVDTSTVLYRADQIDREIMPQEHPFRFVDDLVTLVPRERGVGRIRQDLGEDPWTNYSWFIADGKQYIYPAYLVEALAQVGTAVAMSSEENRGLDPLFGRILSVNLYNLLEAGDEAHLLLDVSGYKVNSPDRGRGAIGRGSGRVVRADGLPILETSISFATREPGQAE